MFDHRSTGAGFRPAPATPALLRATKGGAVKGLGFKREENP
jgi:hypothetical protein